MLFGGGFAAQAVAPNFPTFAAVNIISRIGGSPQHPVGNGLLAEQFPEERRGFAISAHISGGNVGTVVVALVGAWLIANLGWRETVVIFGIPAVVIALAILLLVRESGSDQAAAVAHGSLRDAFAAILRDRDHRWIYLTSVLGGGGRGLGVVNLFALIYLTSVIGVRQGLGPDVRRPHRLLGADAARRRLAVRSHRPEAGDHRVYLGGAIGFLVFVLVGSWLAGLWLGILLMGLFSFAESPQLQALLADIAPPTIRDASFALYFTLAFGVGSLWTALYGEIIDRSAPGRAAARLLAHGDRSLAALAVLPVRGGRLARAAGPRRRRVPLGVGGPAMIRGP